jgi:hypothetical protein
MMPLQPRQRLLLDFGGTGQPNVGKDSLMKVSVASATPMAAIWIMPFEAPNCISAFFSCTTPPFMSAAHFEKLAAGLYPSGSWKS